MYFTNPLLHPHSHPNSVCPSAAILSITTISTDHVEQQSALYHMEIEFNINVLGAMAAAWRYR